MSFLISSKHKSYQSFDSIENMDKNNSINGRPDHVFNVSSSMEQASSNKTLGNVFQLPSGVIAVVADYFLISNFNSILPEAARGHFYPNFKKHLINDPKISSVINEISCFSSSEDDEKFCLETLQKAREFAYKTLIIRSKKTEKLQKMGDQLGPRARIVSIDILPFIKKIQTVIDIYCWQLWYRLYQRNYFGAGYNHEEINKISSTKLNGTSFLATLQNSRVHLSLKIESKKSSSEISRPDVSNNIEQTTADLYKKNELIFVGDFIESRSKVDFNYHSNYQLNRQLLQDRIIHKYLKLGKSVNLPKIIFTAGVMGVGKGHILKKMDQCKQISLQDYLWIDPDQIKDELPETKIYAKIDPQTAATKVHKESGFIEEIILSEALKQSKKIIVDGSLASLIRHKKLFEFIREEYSHYTIEIIYVIADLRKIKERIQRRGETTGRFVPLEKVEYVFHEIPKTIKVLTPLVSNVFVIDNNQDD